MLLVFELMVDSMLQCDRKHCEESEVGGKGSVLGSSPWKDGQRHKNQHHNTLTTLIMIMDTIIEPDSHLVNQDVLMRGRRCLTRGDCVGVRRTKHTHTHTFADTNTHTHTHKHKHTHTPVHVRVRQCSCVSCTSCVFSPKWCAP